SPRAGASKVMATTTWGNRFIDEATLARRQRQAAPTGTVRFSDGGVEFSALIPSPSCRVCPLLGRRWEKARWLGKCSVDPMATTPVCVVWLLAWLSFEALFLPAEVVVVEPPVHADASRTANRKCGDSNEFCDLNLGRLFHPHAMCRCN